MKLLIVGISGMLGNTLLRYFKDINSYEVIGTIRNIDSLPSKFLDKYRNNLVDNIDVFDFNGLARIIANEKPNVVINAVGVIKQKKDSYENNIYINALFPHKLAALCEENNIRFITIATDCVFKGDLPEDKAYTEDSPSDCLDLYGKSKFLGEVVDKSNTLTLRTSIIGHELKSNYSLVDWFLSQNGEVNGFARAYYSGFPTIVFARLLEEILNNHRDLHGLYHLSSEKISKYDLLQIVKEVYGKDIKINKNNDFYINRVLNSDRLRNKIKLNIPSWRDMIIDMHNDFLNLTNLIN